MKTGLKLSTAAVALLTVVGLGMAPASAADLGGNCCADLEERIAELEATTARKGNRKVKLEISGHVNEALIFWDDGFESNSGVYTNDNARTRFRMKGSAKITDDVKAGYLLEIGVRSANSKRFDQNNPSATAGDNNLDVRHSAWYVESKSLGTVWVGRTGPAAEGITEINLANTKDVAKLADLEDSALGLLLRTPTGALSNVQIRRAIRDTGDQAGEPERGQIVKYVSPAFAGFAMSAAWGGDDYWDIGLNYKGEFAGFKMAAGIAYGQESSENADAQIGNCNTSRSAAGVDCEQVGGSLSIMHEETGLYGTFAAGWSEDPNSLALFNGTGDDENTFYAIEAGIERKFFPLGKTTLFGQYHQGDYGSTGRGINVVPGADGIIGSEITMYGGGIVQELSAASMLLYVYYRHIETELSFADTGTGAPIASPGFEDLDMVVAGGMIKF
ncbi:MAG: hypothetical protein B7Y80_16595 [Hyphomicrobium sp. 32-62-53]|nr:MAG: hypothetical protein B7Z29_18675 [Hyphomicrobium sp. 12-62-95]OYX98211.1 MAG: hypothetical protein B7Y80_16595 [Hyphomicrobium sp. 32-62-53]